MKFRTNDKQYMAEVERWFAVLMPKLKPFLYQNGGPIITVQVENEYGWHPACDHSYTSHLRDIFKSYLGSDTVLFTTG
jgi:beta-galactosidase